MLVGGLILVIAMALIGVLYGKAAKIRIIITGETYIQQVANQMMDTIISGGGDPLEGLRCATKIYSNADDATGHHLSSLDITFGNVNGALVRIQIDPTTDETVKRGTKPIPAGDWNITDPDLKNLDFNDKVNIKNTATNNSCFRYYDQEDRKFSDMSWVPDDHRDDIAKIIICLAAKSSLSAISRTIILYNSVTIRNIYHID